MTGEQVIGELMALRHTVEKLKDPYIISADVYSNQSAVQLHVDGDPTDVLGGAIGNDLYRVEHDSPDGWGRCSITDTNGVEVFWMEKRKAAPDVAASRAEEEEEVIIEYTDSSCTIISAGGRKVKEEA
jgi:hypothetical protein